MKFLNSNYSSNYANFASKADNFLKDLKKATEKGPKTPTQLPGPQFTPSNTGFTPASPKSPAGSKPDKFLKDLKRATDRGRNKGVKLLRKAGKFVKNNKVGVGLAGAGALGAVGYGVYRKMRSDKGKKRGSYN